MMKHSDTPGEIVLIVRYQVKMELLAMTNDKAKSTKLRDIRLSKKQMINASDIRLQKERY
jgi:hypothetical protein